jgi:capsular polysaccharide biosynthesis protein
MTERALDLRRSFQIVRRHKVLVGLIAVLGLLLGAAYAVLNPPLLTSTALVVLPQSAVNPQSVQATGSPVTATQVVIADSTPVLSAALSKVSPATSLESLRGEIQVSSLTPFIISVSARGKHAADVEATANAVAGSYIAYVSSANSPGGRVSAGILQSATTASGKTPLEMDIIFGVIGALVGALAGAIIALSISRKDRRLRERDEIANAIGVPVLASFPVHHPGDAAAWTKLLEDYEPGAVHGWRMRQALHQLRIADVNLNNGSDGGSYSLTILSLSTDPASFAIGPQLGVFTASLGISTVLYIGPQQDANVTAALRTACAVPPSASSKRPRQLQVVVSDDGRANGPPGAALTIVVVVVDSQAPHIPETLRTTATALGVSAGTATSDQLARAAVSAAADGREIVGVLVADPDPGDRTTGRVPQLPPPPQRRLPTRLKGITTEIRR